jgi:transcriptional regulator with XRE-family HTH domain
VLPVAASADLKHWIHEQLEKRGWSMREASTRAGLSEGRISQIMRDQVPGIEACIKMAHAFGVPPTYVLFLAGYLERDPSRGVPPELQNILDMLESMRDEPLYNEVLRTIDMVISIAAAKMDAPD